MVEGKDCLNLHRETIYVMRKDGHYDIIYTTEGN